jgi:arginase/N-omega-hydroxy-L-arginine amidinohydrolase
MLAALPSAQVAGIELAEFEAGDDEARNAQAGAVILDIVAPLFAARSGG